MANDNQDDSFSSFAQAVKGVTPLKQDKIHFAKSNSKYNKHIQGTKSTDPAKEELASNRLFQFSDEYEPYIDTKGPISFVADDQPSYYAKLLRNGALRPELILDLHGYNKLQAQQDIAALINQCQQQHLLCACIVHGVSGGILKHKVPHYLMQHPGVLAFHQAPLEWGGQGAIVIMIDLGEEVELLLRDI